MNPMQEVVKLVQNDSCLEKDAGFPFKAFGMEQFMGNGSADDPPLFDPRRQTQTFFKVQLYVCSVLGLICFFTFCFLRYRFPLFFSIRSYRNKKIKKLPHDMFSWIKILISINNEQLLQVVGLESYVFLCFFRMSIKILSSLSILGLCILSPIRYFMLGSFDKDTTSSNFFQGLLAFGNDDRSNDAEPFAYLAICTVFTYIFTAIIFYFLFKETNHIIKTRQKFLGSQRSVTDRTIFIKNIPAYMRNETDLKTHIQELNVGKVDQINFVYDYSPLVNLYEQRDHLINTLEVLYANTCGIDINLFRSIDVQSVHLKVIETKKSPNNYSIQYSPEQMKSATIRDSSDSTGDKYFILNTENDVYNCKKKTCFKLTKSNKELIDRNIRELLRVNDEITQLKANNEFKRLSTAFVTMDSVTDAQMAAQAVFSPKVFELVTELAPAPLDINWNNLLLDTKSIFLRKNIIEFIILVFSCLLIIPIRYITSLLNVNSIRKIWKEFGDYLISHEKVRTLVTGLLPTYLFTIINVVLPYVISLLSTLQGLSSKGDVELSIIKKNFLYIFFNLFLVFTLFGTLSSYKALLTDTTKIAPLLATSIKSLSLFYVDLILLQGLTMFPFKLLQIGDLSILFWNFIVNYKSRTPRLFRDFLYKPPIFDLGLILPQHIVIFIITILYSSISTKILVSGLVYFILGFYTYKYQLVYSLVHPYHSTGKAWPIIFKRICLGIFFLHLQMFGSLALEQSFILAGLMLPLFPTTIIALMFFNSNYQPLLHYIALDAIKTHGESVENDSTDDGLNGLLLTGTSPTNTGSMRRASVANFNRFLDGDDQCDAVLMNGCINNSSNIDGEVLIDDTSEVETDETTSANVQNSAQPRGNETVSFPNSIDSKVIDHSPRSNILLDAPPHRRCSTIEEEREATQCYVHPCLLDKSEGLLIGFNQDDIDYLKFRIVNNSDDLIFRAENEIDSARREVHAVQLEETDNNTDVEIAKGKLKGYVTRLHASEEIW